MPSGIQVWSQTAGSNGNADSTINFLEGQAPSSLNDSNRAMMARIADYYKDLGGLTTSGSSTAYTATSNRAFASAAAMDGSVIVIRPHTTSGASPTLAVDGLTARQIRSATGTNVATGALISGTPYAVVYIHASTEFVLLGYTETLGTLTVTGTSTFTGAATFNGGGALGTGTYTGAATFSGNLIFSGTPNYTNVTKAMGIAGGTTAQRNGSPTNGDVRYNTTLAGLEYWNGTAWIVLGQASAPQRFLSGSGTCTPSTGVVRWRVRMCGGGGGGGAQTAGSNGGTTTFGSWTAVGGTGGPVGTSAGGGAGGTGGATGTGTLILHVDGGGGLSGTQASTSVPGGAGGTNPFGGQAVTVRGLQPGAAVANTGAGGGGGGSTGAATGNGGGAGEYVEFWVNNPTATSYAVGGGANGGAAGTVAGGNSGSGIIIVEEFYA